MQDRTAIGACAAVTWPLQWLTSPYKITIVCNYRKGLSCRRGFPDGRTSELSSYTRSKPAFHRKRMLSMVVTEQERGYSRGVRLR